MIGAGATAQEGDRKRKELEHRLTRVIGAKAQEHNTDVFSFAADYLHCAFLGTEVVWPDKGQGKKKAYTSYNIAVSLQGTDAKWFLKSRWSRFERLAKAVKQELAGQEADPLPVLSAKTGEDAVGASILNARGWLNPLDPDLVEQRRVAVQSFINALIERPAVLRSAAFMDFLLPGEAVVAAEAAVAGVAAATGGDAVDSHSVHKKKDVVLPDPIPWSDDWLSPAEGVADMWADEGVLAEDLAKPLAPSAEHWQDRPRQRCTLNQLVARLTSAVRPPLQCFDCRRRVATDLQRCRRECWTQTSSASSWPLFAAWQRHTSCLPSCGSGLRSQSRMWCWRLAPSIFRAVSRPWLWPLGKSAASPEFCVGSYADSRQHCLIQPNACRVRVVKLLESWLRTYWRVDFRDDPLLQGRLRGLIDAIRVGLQVVGPQQAEQLIKCWKEVGASAAENATTGAGAARASSALPPQPLLPALPRDQTARLLDWDPLEIARQMTLLDERLYAQLQPHDLLGAVSGDSVVAKSVSLLDDVAAWVLTMVISVHVDGADGQSAQVLGHWVRVAAHLRKLRSFNMLFAVMTAIGRCGHYENPETEETVLHETREALLMASPALAESLDELQAVSDPRSSFGTYRQLLADPASAGVPTLPWLLHGLDELAAHHRQSLRESAKEPASVADLHRTQSGPVPHIQFAICISQWTIASSMTNFSRYNLAPVVPLQKLLRMGQGVATSGKGSGAGKAQQPTAGQPEGTVEDLAEVDPLPAIELAMKLEAS